MAHILVFLVILICIGFLYLRGNLIKSFGMIIIALFAAIASFGYYEILAQFLISRVTGRLDSLVPWLHSISFLLIYLLTFAILQAILMQLTRQQIDFGKKAELISKIAAGIIIGIIFSGAALIVLALAPLPTKYPYQRFDSIKPTLQRAKKVFLNPDGFITWLFARTSDGSLSAFTNKKSFASLHPDFIDQIHLNKIGFDQKIPTTSTANEIFLPAQNAAWIATQSLTDSAGNTIAPKAGNDFIIVKVGIKKSYGKAKPTFNIAQLRLICKPKSKGAAITGPGQNIYPTGYLKTAEKIKTTDLNYKIELANEDLNDTLPQGTGKWIDFVFEVPNNLAPIAVEFRQNNIAQVPALTTADKALPVSIFIPSSDCAKDFAETEPNLKDKAKIFGISITAQNRLLEDLSLEVSTPEDLKKLIEDNNNPPKFEDNKLEYATVRLKTKTATQKSASASSARSLQGLPAMLKPLEGYSILAMKCNNPALGSQITPADLPVLIDLNEKTSYPVGLIASGKMENTIVYQLDYCAIPAEKEKTGLQIDENGNVSKPFPKDIWIMAQPQIESIGEFFLLYLIKNDRIITKVRPPNTQSYQSFKSYQGFLVK